MEPSLGEGCDRVSPWLAWHGGWGSVLFSDFWSHEAGPRGRSDTEAQEEAEGVEECGPPVTRDLSLLPVVPQFPLLRLEGLHLV